MVMLDFIVLCCLAFAGWAGTMLLIEIILMAMPQRTQKPLCDPAGTHRVISLYEREFSRN
ncbi:MAG TPA: hypothetical protein VI937_01140 [Negativicutes bacterium]|nr:hypothetical protein [Negativicutes bacterium]